MKYSVHQNKTNVVDTTALYISYMQIVKKVWKFQCSTWWYDKLFIHFYKFDPIYFKGNTLVTVIGHIALMSSDCGCHSNQKKVLMLYMIPYQNICISKQNKS